MNAKHDVERRLTDHYATEAPSRAPDWLLGRALGTVDITPQRRTVRGRSWRISPMPSPGRLAVGALAIVTIAAVGLTVVRVPSVGPAATASPEPSSSPSPFGPPPLTERFDSALNGMSMSYPAGWQVRPATERWTDGVMSFGAPGVDVIFDPTYGEDLYLAVASEPLPFESQPDEAWRAGVTLPPCGGGHGGSVLTFDGASGWVSSCGGLPSHQSALLTTSTHGYAIVLNLGERALLGAYSDAWFVSVLETMDLRAQDAPLQPNPSDAP